MITNVNGLDKRTPFPSIARMMDLALCCRSRSCVAYLCINLCCVLLSMPCRFLLFPIEGDDLAVEF